MNKPIEDADDREETPAPPAEPAAWEEIEEGRYMPRRVRGSCLGRELG